MRLCKPFQHNVIFNDSLHLGQPLLAHVSEIQPEGAYGFVSEPVTQVEALFASLHKTGLMERTRRCLEQKVGLFTN
jgi:hypothetical protein